MAFEDDLAMVDGALVGVFAVDAELTTTEGPPVVLRGIFAESSEIQTHFGNRLTNGEASFFVRSSELKELWTPDSGTDLELGNGRIFWVSGRTDDEFGGTYLRLREK